MVEGILGYILQILTILITLGLGLVTCIQTRQLQKSQNIVSVTTRYRLDRTEQLRTSCQQLMSNSVPELLCEKPEYVLPRLERLYDAAAQVAAILHRCYEKDLELMQLAEAICASSYELFKARQESSSEARLKTLYGEVLKNRKIFLIRCDLYTYAEWVRVKKETAGVNTKTEEWFSFYEEKEAKYEEELKAICEESAAKEPV